MNVTVSRSRFTPSLMPHDLLERLFVAREQNLEQIIARVKAAASSSERNHTLLVGPRGSGKTHLVSLAYYRVRNLQRSGSHLQVAWLPEDPWTIVSYLHLLRAVAARLEPQLEEALPGSTSELEAVLVHRAARHGPIVVIVENLDQILDALGDQGQQQLRHLLQAHRPFLLVATSTRIDRALSDQAAPFYGFFTTTRLKPFDVEEAAAMLSAIAVENDDERLVAYLQSDAGRARLRTITHLAGGQPRIWALLASALTVEGLGELIELLLTRFDDLTPYYQEQLGHLSGQQRLIIAELADIDRPVSVGDLGRRVGIDQRSLSKTLSELVDRGWVTPTQSTLTVKLDRRRTYYELAEPLARLSFQIKESRGEPLRLIVEFLMHWFDPADLRAPIAPAAAEYVALAVTGQEKDPVVAVTRRLNRLPATRGRAVDLLGSIDDALAAYDNADPEPLLSLPTPIRTAVESQLETRSLASVRRWVHQNAWEEFGDVPHPAIDAWITRAERWLTSTHDGDAAIAQGALVHWLTRAWRFGEAEEALTAMDEMVGITDPDTLTARAELVDAYSAAGRGQRAVDVGEETLARCERALGREHPATSMCRTSLVLAYLSLWRIEEALSLVEEEFESTERELGPEDPRTLRARVGLALGHWTAGRRDAAVAMMEDVVAKCKRLLGAEHHETLAATRRLCTMYRREGRLDEAVTMIESLVAISERVLGGEHPDTLTARTELAGSYVAGGRSDEAVAVMEGVVAISERVLGGEHPDTLTARAELASTYQADGRSDEAVAVMEDAVGTSMRLFGVEHPDALVARIRLAQLYLAAGRSDEARTTAEDAFGPLERLLGSHHQIAETYRAFVTQFGDAAGQHD